MIGAAESQHALLSCGENAVAVAYSAQQPGSRRPTAMLPRVDGAAYGTVSTLTVRRRHRCSRGAVLNDDATARTQL